MFDVGFSEMVVCAIVALVVIGPERLPKVARTLGVLFGRMQRYVAQVKADINREMEMADLGKVKTEFEAAARSFQTDMESQARDLERDVRDAQTSIERSLDGKPLPESSGEAVPQPLAEPSPQLELPIGEPAATPSAKPAP